MLAQSLRQGRQRAYGADPVQLLRGLHLGGALRLRPHQRPTRTLDGSCRHAHRRRLRSAAATASPATATCGRSGTRKHRSCTSTRRAAATGRRSACATACRTTAARPRSGSLVYRKTKLLKTFTRALRTTDDAVAYWVGFSFAQARHLPLLRPRERRRGQPQLARLRGDPQGQLTFRRVRQPLRPRAPRPRSASSRPGRRAPRALPSSPGPSRTSRR